MESLQDKSILVVGLTGSGRAACRLLRERGAQVTALERADTAEIREAARELRHLGVTVELGEAGLPAGQFAFAVVSPEMDEKSLDVRGLKERGIPVLGELELGYQQSSCLHIAVSGSNGKTSAADLIVRLLTHAQRKTRLAGNCAAPVCAAAPATRELDFLTVEASAFQLERIKYFRPTVAVLLNIAHDHFERYATHADYVRAKARLFMNQQPFDWAIVQSEAWAQMRTLNLPMPGKVITFSVSNRRADIFLDRSLIISRLPDWAGPLVDLNQCELRGPHHAENFMAALAVGHVLRLPLEQMLQVIKTIQPLPHRCELVAEIDGVKYINDSKSLNLAALRSAILAMPGEPEPNVWLIAGGKDKGHDYHDLGPLLSERVKGAFLIGEMREKLRAAWGLFTPCVLSDSLLEALTQAAEKAVSGDIVLLSPACSSFDQFQNYQNRGELFRRWVDGRACTRYGVGAESDHHKRERKESVGGAQSAKN